MANNTPARRPISISKVVVLGVLSGGVAWLPLVWLEPIPQPVVSTSASSAPPGARPARLINPTVPLPSGDRPALSRVAPAAATQWQPTHDTDPTDVEDAVPADDMPVGESVDSSKTDELLLQPATPLTRREQPLRQPREKASPATHVRIGEEGMLPIEPATAAVAQLHTPPSVAVARFETPVIGTATSEGDKAVTIERMHDLNSADERVATAAADALAALGFSEAHLTLGRKLTSPDARVRASLAAELPGAAGIDARLWLTWLLRDDDADVRLAALAVLATTGDPETLHRTLEIARQDPNPRIRQQIVQLEKLRRKNQ